MKFRVGVAAFLAVLCLGACGQSSESPGSTDGESTNAAQSADSGEESKGTLNVLFMSGVYADSARSMTEEFKEKTGYDVEVNDVPFASFHETAMLDFASQAGSYDVVAVNLSWLGEFAPHLEPLDA